ncbi:unnamed protein product [Amoebophrya sp. A120]|nr:unnamed protein product [Amoebophrya sp. A120]|eukprot:GSA120T00008261001.1
MGEDDQDGAGGRKPPPWNNQSHTTKKPGSTTSQRPGEEAEEEDDEEDVLGNIELNSTVTAESHLPEHSNYPTAQLQQDALRRYQTDGNDGSSLSLGTDFIFGGATEKPSVLLQQEAQHQFGHGHGGDLQPDPGPGQRPTTSLEDFIDCLNTDDSNHYGARPPAVLPPTNLSHDPRPPPPSAPYPGTTSPSPPTPPRPPSTTTQQHQPSASSTAPHPPGPPDDGFQCDDCPICFEPIDPAEAAMRCKNRSHPHFFHSSCLSAWIQTARQQRIRPSCPICRNDVEFHAKRLNQFLQEQQRVRNGGASSSSSSGDTMTDEDLGFFQSIYQNLDDTVKDGWSNVTWENVTYAGGLIACFGWGFYSGYNYDRMYVPLELIPQQTDNRVAQGVGWFAGVLAREIKRWHDRKSRRDD